MTKETLKELGKGFITFGNSVGALSVVYGLFEKGSHNIPTSILAAIVTYIVVMAYAGGIIAIEKGANDDWNIYSISDNRNRNVYIRTIGKTN